MQAEKRTRKVTHHEWTLKSPAHATEVEKTLIAARNHATRFGRPAVDIWITAHDDLVVIGYAENHEQNDVTVVPEQRDGQ